MFQVIKGLAPDIFWNAFNTRNKLKYYMRHASHFDVPLVKSIYNGTESISFLGSKIWDILHNEIKEMETVQAFKAARKMETRKLPVWTL